jgi:hypothetical protein
MEIKDVLEPFFKVKMMFIDEYSREHFQVLYETFIKDCLEYTDDDKSFIPNLEKEVEIGGGDIRPQPSMTVTLLFKELYGEPTHPREDKYPGSRQQLDQMLNAEFVLASIGYLASKLKK